ncbi:MAG TPA: SDR family oxidoreductase [Opitutaceae bacterium]|nr:SDR family oxidoreductase [Opitutaceae bacterium]
MATARFAQRVVWITGASSGIGEALAVAFAREGAQLVLSSRREEELERVAVRCAGGPRPFVLPLDLTRPQEFASAAAAVQTRFGRLDVLVNNGGVGERALAQDTLPAVERAVMEVNYFGAVGLTKAALPILLAQRSGCIVTMSSVMGYVGTPKRAAYAASKHALRGWFDSLRAEIEPQGVHVCLVCPGWVRTNISRNALTADGAAHARMDRTQERGVAPERVAESTLRAVLRRRDEVLVGGGELWAVRLKRHFPRLWAWVLRRAVARGLF